MNIFDSKRLFGDYSGLYPDSPIGKMYLNRTKDPALAAKAICEQQKLVALVAGMTDEKEETVVQEITNLLEANVDPSVPDYNLSLYYAGKNFYSPIHYAVKKDLFKITTLLLSHSANPNALDRYSVTPAHLAAEHGSLRCLKKLIEHKADVNAKTQQFRKPTRGEYHQDPVVRDGLEPEEFSFHLLPYHVRTTPLHLAARHNHIECVKVLIDQGADYNASDEKSQTPLYLAAKAGLPECVMVLLENAVGFPILSIETKDGDTALHECLRHGESMRQCIKELVQVGADVSLHNIHQESAIHLALKHKWDMEMIKFLVIEGYNMDFDRIHFEASSSYERARRSPLIHAVFAERRQQQGTGNGGANNRIVTFPENRDESVAVFFVRMGASRRDLKDLLWHELNREAEGGLLLATLMDCFPYLPVFTQLVKDTEEVSYEEFVYSSDEEMELYDQAMQLHQTLPSDRAGGDPQERDFDVILRDLRRRNPPGQVPIRRDYNARFLRGLHMPLTGNPLFQNRSRQPGGVQARQQVQARRQLRRNSIFSHFLPGMDDDHPPPPLPPVPTLSRFLYQRRAGRVNIHIAVDDDDDDIDDFLRDEHFLMDVNDDRDDNNRQQTRRAAQTNKPLSESLVSQKKKEYLRRSNAIPALAHLSRCVVRDCMQAKVREVIKFPIPTPLKEYILLGYPLVSRQKGTQMLGMGQDTEMPEAGSSTSKE